VSEAGAADESDDDGGPTPDLPPPAQQTPRVAGQPVADPQQ
jgi:hypothetical protein